MSVPGCKLLIPHFLLRASALYGLAGHSSILFCQTQLLFLIKDEKNFAKGGLL
jgi:hypothetical protein